MSSLSSSKFERVSFFLFGFAMLAIIGNFLLSSRSPQTTTQDISAERAFDGIMVEERGVVQKALTNVQQIADYHSHKVQNGDTLTKILASMGMQNPEAHVIANVVNKASGIKNLGVGQKIQISLSAKDGSKIKNEDSVYNISIDIDGRIIDGTYDKEKRAYSLKPIKNVITIKSKLAQGLVQNSLYRSAIKAGASPTAVANYIKLLENEINVKKEIKPDSEFKILFDYKEDSYGKRVGDGEIVYAYLSLGNRKFEVYKHKDKNAKSTYFYANGKSLKKSLLARPISTTKISSGFGVRVHPIHHYRKMHTGVDYAAKVGTPISAAGNGIVQLVTFNSGYGRHTVIKHNAQYSTLYAHMSKFHPAIKKGARVIQGQVIGYVGSSGSSTGPHLHYEVRQNGRPINPIKSSPNISDPLEGKMLVAFRSQKQRIDKVVHKESKMALAQKN
jgi:murein DD-endopeptidase MepM/ murein hydrolase activator NlpD